MGSDRTTPFRLAVTLGIVCVATCTGSGQEPGARAPRATPFRAASRPFVDPGRIDALIGTRSYGHYANDVKVGHVTVTYARGSSAPAPQGKASGLESGGEAKRGAQVEASVLTITEEVTLVQPSNISRATTRETIVIAFDSVPPYLLRWAERRVGLSDPERFFESPSSRFEQDATGAHIVGQDPFVGQVEVAVPFVDASFLDFAADRLLLTGSPRVGDEARVARPDLDMLLPFAPVEGRDRRRLIRFG